MTPTAHTVPYKVERQGGRFIIYNASAIGDPPGHEAGKWYARPWAVGLAPDDGGPHETAEEAERSLSGEASALATATPASAAVQPSSSDDPADADTPLLRARVAMELMRSLARSPGEAD